MVNDTFAHANDAERGNLVSYADSLPILSPHLPIPTLPHSLSNESSETSKDTNPTSSTLLAVPLDTHVSSTNTSITMAQMALTLNKKANPELIDDVPHELVSRYLNTTRSKLPRPSLWVQFQLMFTTYRKFFTFVFTLNIIGILLASIGHFPYANNHVGAILLGNLLTAVMMRNELFLRILYCITIHTLAKWPPLSVRIGATSALQHIGGIHSGCATSGLAWIVYKVVQIVRDRHYTANPVIAMGLITNVAILISVISAFPWVRNVHHNIFEKYHRFIGWLGITSTWVFVYLGNCYNPSTGVCERNARHLISDQQFWFVLGMTVFVAIPWIFTRRVAVDVEIPSDKVAIIRFKRGMQQGLLGRISRTTLMEYHAFGIISEGTHAPYHYMVCGVQGDFTRGLVFDPPKYLWTREIKFAGVSNTSKLYRRGIRICTGTGIGAALSTCLQDDGWFLIWIGSDQIKTFGTTIHRLIVDNIPPERRILWDSRKMGGRPELSLLEDTFYAWKAEVIFITSNDAGNREMMQYCKEKGLPAFGTLFDF